MSLAANSIRALMKGVLPPEVGKEIPDATVESIEACTGELLNLVASTAEHHTLKEGRQLVTNADILWAVQHLGFNGYLEPLSSHAAEHYGGVEQPAKRKREEPPSTSAAPWPHAAAAVESNAIDVLAALAARTGGAFQLVPARGGAAAAGGVRSHPAEPA
ncbi:hypothetical protein AB1Y20_017063 [Prymnesium parvum]|uniref:Transcription factor CBF/NF-Y/archaeal histone domain-containing protein n=1 Tax=Prymnesium parvum TaxID=97485 RepID=A0AB34ICS4_PRYPA